jgi:hypothetical protein
MRPLALVVVLSLVGLATRSASADPKQVCNDAYEQGQTLRDQHKLIKAREQLRLCAAPSCAPAIVKECTEWLKDIEPRIPSVVLTAKNGAGADVTDVKVTMDGAPLAGSLDGLAVDVDPGPHTFVFEGAAGRTEQKVLVAEGGKSQRVAASFGGGVAVAVAVPAGAASAPGQPAAGEKEGIRLPVSYVERGITNPALILSPELDIGVVRVAGALGNTITAGALQLGAGFSITDDFGVRATILALQLNSPFQYTGPSFGATYRFVKGDFELGAAADVTIATPSGVSAGVVFTPSIPARVHFGKTARLDITAGLPVTAGEGLKSAVVGLGIPVVLSVDIVEPLHVGVGSGFEILDFSQAGHTVAVPLGFIAGYAVAGPHGPIVDIDPFFEWPYLFTPGTTGPGSSKVQAGFFQLGLTVTGYLYL